MRHLRLSVSFCIYKFAPSRRTLVLVLIYLLLSQKGKTFENFARILFSKNFKIIEMEFWS